MVENMDTDFKDFIEKVRNAADIVEVIGGYVSLKKRGSKHWACCPFHGEKTPSFTVDEGKQLFYCFGCHLGGDIFKFVQQKEGITFIDAVKKLAERYNIPVPERQKSSADLAKEKLFNRVTEINDWASKYFMACLVHNKVGAEARAYLSGRGISRNIIESFQIGYARNSYDDLIKALKTKNIAENEIITAGLAIEGKGLHPYSKFRNRVMIPIKDPRGKIVGFGGRILGEGDPKYLNTGETDVFNKRYLLFGFDIAQKSMREKGKVIVVEGYMDAISLHSAGFSNVVASMGTAFSEQQAVILRRNAKEIIFCYDSDEPGRNASIRAVSIVRQLDIPVKVAIVPDAKDPDEYIRGYGKDYFQKVIDNALSGLDFQIQETLAKFDLTILQGKIDAVKEIVKFLAESHNDFEVADEVKKLAQKLTIEEVLISDELNKLKHNNSRKFRQVTPLTGEKVEENKHTDSRTEQILLSVLIQNSHLLSSFANELIDVHWSQLGCERIYKLLVKFSEEDKSFDSLSDELSCEDNSLLTFLKMSKIPKEEEKTIVRDCLISLKITHLKKQYNVHATLAAEYEKCGDSRLIDELRICEEIRNGIKKCYKKE